MDYKDIKVSPPWLCLNPIRCNSLKIKSWGTEGGHNSHSKSMQCNKKYATKKYAIELPMQKRCNAHIVEHNILYSVHNSAVWGGVDDSVIIIVEVEGAMLCTL